MELEVLVAFEMSIFRDLKFVGELQPLSEDSQRTSHDNVNHFRSSIILEDFPEYSCKWVSK